MSSQTYLEHLKGTRQILRTDRLFWTAPHPLTLTAMTMVTKGFEGEV